MKTTSINLLGLGAASLLLFSCGVEQTETIDAPGLESKPAKSNEPAPTPDSDSATATGLDLDELMASLSSGAPLSGDFGDLSEEHRKTLQAATEKAVAEIDFGLLTTAIEDQIGAQLGAKLGDLSGSLSSGDIQVLTPEQAKELGLDLEKIGKGSASSVTIRTQVLPLSSNPGAVGSDGQPEAQFDSETKSEVVPKVTVLEAEAIDDPEISQRIQQHMESGDSDALAAELKSLLQDSIDGAAINQLLEPAGAEEKQE